VLVALVCWLMAWSSSYRVVHIKGTRLTIGGGDTEPAADIDLLVVEAVLEGGELHARWPDGRTVLIGTGQHPALRAAQQCIREAQGVPPPPPLPHRRIETGTSSPEDHRKQREGPQGMQMELSAQRTPWIWMLSLTLIIVGQSAMQLGARDFSPWVLGATAAAWMSIHFTIEWSGWVQFEMGTHALKIVRKGRLGSRTVPYDAISRVDVSPGWFGAWSRLEIYLANGEVVRSRLGRQADHLEIQRLLRPRLVAEPAAGAPEEIQVLMDRG